jgi:hypothetical protein
MNLIRLARGIVGPFFVAAAAVFACGLQTLVFGPPVPAIHDEFSYLLAADTFRHGRCTNPTHPLWRHLETIHVLQKPTYASKYPPGQGLFLAAGWLLGGHPVVGVWLGVGLACGASCWMLRAFLPRWWAICGGLLMASRLGFSEWGWGYMGGGVAAAGGALFLGGWIRVFRRPCRSHSAIMALGLVLLAVSRPFEGLVLCLPVGLATIIRLIRRRPPAGVILRQVVAPALAVLVPAALALGYYNNRVTGNPLQLPYMAHAAQYDVAPVLLVLPPNPVPTYRHEVLKVFHVDAEFHDYLSGRTLEGWASRARGKLLTAWEFFLGYGLSVSLLALPWVLRQSPRTRFALVSCIVVFGVVITMETWGLPTYTAPAACLVYLVVTQGFRRISLWRWRQRSLGRWFTTAWLTGCLLVPSLCLFNRFSDRIQEWGSSRLPAAVMDELRTVLFHRATRKWAEGRAALIRSVQESGGRYLVIVRYGRGHSVMDEFVYNDADIDGSPVVWAREMDQEGRARLLSYFTDRTVLLLESDEHRGQTSLLRGPISTSRSPPEGGR